MAFVIADRVRETTTTTGTGAVTLGGAYTGFQAFSAAIGNGNSTYYTISSLVTGQWEVGIGTYTSSTNTLSRDTILASSNSGSVVTLSAGSKDVFVTQPAERAVYVTGTDVIAANNASVKTTYGGTGLTTYTAGDLPYYATGTAFSKLAIGASKTILTSTGSAPQWSASLDTTQGGTGLTTYTAGDLPYYATGTSLSKLSVGTANQVLTSSGTAPQWSTNLSIGTLTASGNSAFTSTGYLSLPNGTTAERPGSPTVGMIRYNSTTNQFEGYSGASPSWLPVGGASISNDTSTSTNVYPAFVNATSGTATTVYTGNANLLYKPSTGEFQARVPVASNGIFVNSQTVATSYTIAAGYSGMSSGPVTVASGQSVTVSSGSRWVVV